VLRERLLRRGTPDELDRDLDRAIDALDKEGLADAREVQKTGRLRRASSVLRRAKGAFDVAGKALGPLGTGASVYGVATASTTGEKIQAWSDLTADVAGYAGPVGTVFSTSYGLTQLADQSIGYASRKALGRDLSPSTVSGDALTAADRLVSTAISGSDSHTLGYRLVRYFNL
jgi:hypothetical protein